MKCIWIVLLLALALMSSNGFSQNVSLGIIGGASIVQATPTSTYTNDIARGGLGFGLSYSIGAVARLTTDQSRISIVGRLTHFHAGASGNLIEEGLFQQGAGQVLSKLDVWSLSVGPEWNILGSRAFSPFVGASYILSSFGKSHYKLTNAMGSVDYLAGGGVRSGFGLDAGVHFSVTSTIQVDAWTSYNFMSLGSVFGPGDFRAWGANTAILFAVF